MASFVLVVALIYAPGNGQVVGNPYPTMEACQIKLATIGPIIKSSNAKGVNQKVAAYAADCLEVKPAPEGDKM